MSPEPEVSLNWTPVPRCACPQPQSCHEYTQNKKHLKAKAREAHRWAPIHFRLQLCVPWPGSCAHSRRLSGYSSLVSHPCTGFSVQGSAVATPPGSNPQRCPQSSPFPVTTDSQSIYRCHWALRPGIQGFVPIKPHLNHMYYSLHAICWGKINYSWNIVLASPNLTVHSWYRHLSLPSYTQYPVPQFSLLALSQTYPTIFIFFILHESTRPSFA